MSTRLPSQPQDTTLPFEGAYRAQIAALESAYSAVYAADSLADCVAAFLRDGDTAPSRAAVVRRLTATYERIEAALAGTGVTPLSRRLLGHYELTADGVAALDTVPAAECAVE